MKLRDIRGRMWFYWGFYWRPRIHSCDEYHRATIMIPFGFGAFVIARNNFTCAFDLLHLIEEEGYKIIGFDTWKRWHRIHNKGIRLSYK